MTYRFGMRLCDRCGKRLFDFPTWIVNRSGGEERALCEACAVEVRDEIDSHEKVTVVAIPTELAKIPEGF